MCGNDGCTEDPIYMILRTCRNETIPFNFVTSGVVKDIPRVRICVECTMPIEHKNTGCKHVTCSSCKTKFCHVCLKVPNGDSWPCKGAYEFCPSGIAKEQEP